MSTPAPPPAGAPGPAPAPGPLRRSGRALSTRSVVLLCAVLLLLVVFAIGQLIRMPYVIFSPGPAQDTLGSSDGTPVVQIDGTRTYPTDGSLDFTTVSLYGGPDHPVSFWRWARAKFDDNSVIQPEKDVFGDKTGQEIQQESAAEMTGSQQSAEVVGVRATGAKVGEQVYVGSIAEGSPAAGKLRAGDRMLQINGTATPTLTSVHGVMDKVTAGQPVRVTISRDGKQSTVSVGTTRGEDGRALMGIVLAPRYTFPYTVKVNAGDVGGPSAGLMFSLAIYDKLTPGALTGGENFAGTGTIDVDGSVGPIGGIQQKMVGARDTGVDHFLAPADNCGEVRGNVPDGLSVYKVSTFDDARSVVQKVAAGQTSGLPTC